MYFFKGVAEVSKRYFLFDLPFFELSGNSGRFSLFFVRMFYEYFRFIEFYYFEFEIVRSISSISHIVNSSLALPVRRREARRLSFFEITKLIQRLVSIIILNGVLFLGIPTGSYFFNNGSYFIQIRSGCRIAPHFFQI